MPWCGPLAFLLFCFLFRWFLPFSEHVGRSFPSFVSSIIPLVVLKICFPLSSTSDSCCPFLHCLSFSVLFLAPALISCVCDFFDISSDLMISLFISVISPLLPFLFSFLFLCSFLDHLVVLFSCIPCPSSSSLALISRLLMPPDLCLVFSLSILVFRFHNFHLCILHLCLT